MFSPMNLLMDALKFCQSQLTGHPLVCWELVSGGIKRNLSICVFSGKTNLDCVGWDWGEVFFFFTPQLRITWQGKCLSHWNGCRWGGVEKGSLQRIINRSPCMAHRMIFRGSYYPDMASAHLNLHHFPTITPESHSTSLLFTVPPWFAG